MDKVRIDKWLWAARFFKTRNLAKDAIDGGKVHWNNQRIKASKEITVGMVLVIRQGYDQKVVEVTALADKRGNATTAATLYKETDESIAARENQAELRKASRTLLAAEHRPNKKQRRQIHRFKRQDSHEQD